MIESPMRPEATIRKSETNDKKYPVRIKLLSSTLFFIVGVVLYSIFAVRDNEYISDALNYVMHGQIGVELDIVADSFYPLYWILIWCIRIFFDPESVPSVLSLVVSALIVLAAVRLPPRYRWLFLAFCVLNAAIFNVTQVALRNGIALGLILLSLAYQRPLFAIIAPLVHPGTLPISMILISLKYVHRPRYLIMLGILSGVLMVFLFSYFNLLSDSRGYEVGVGRTGKFMTYLAVGGLAVLYYLAMRQSSYRYFLPIFLVFWVVISMQYEFGGRIFLQSLIVALFLVLVDASRNKFRQLYLLAFFGFSVYGALLWHPLVEYRDGWLGYWFS